MTGASSGWFVLVIMSPAAVSTAEKYWCGIVVDSTCTSSVQLPDVTTVTAGEMRRVVLMDCELGTRVQTVYFFIHSIKIP